MGLMRESDDVTIKINGKRNPQFEQGLAVAVDAAMGVVDGVSVIAPSADGEIIGMVIGVNLQGDRVPPRIKEICMELFELSQQMEGQMKSAKVN